MIWHLPSTAVSNTPPPCVPSSVERKAITKSGLQHLAPPPPTPGAPCGESEEQIQSTVDWSESAVYGEHIWFETNVSGDFCYVGEQHCVAKMLPKSAPRKKCAACKIVVHTQCIKQLEKINFRCKPSFRESGSRNVREPTFVRHHWVHRRRQDGKCRHCGKGFQQKFTFHSKEIVAISCSWCKQAYHSKVSCFMMQQIEEPCSLGVHAAVVIPPTWILRARRPQNTLKASKKKKRASFKRRSSKKGPEEGRWRPFIIRPTPSPLMKPLLVFVNPKSGGNQGAKIIQSFLWYLNPRQVFDLSQGGPREALEMYRKVHNLRILACGGDGTVGWILSTTAKAIPVQVDGEPCKLSASRIRIALRNQATMVQKAKRRSTAPLHSDQQPVPEQLRIQVSRVSMHDYEALHYDKEQLKEASVPLGTVVVPGDSDLELCRAHIERLQREPDGAGAKSPMCHQLSSKWCFLDATTASRFYRIDRAQEHLNYVTEIAQDEIYILDPELLGASARPDLPTPTSPLPASPCSPTPGSMQGDTALPQGEELIEAAKRNDCCKLQELHRAGGDLMHRDQKSRTLLHHAVSTGSKEVVRYLLDHAPPEILDAVEENGETCLHQAAALGQRTICHYIVEAGASLMKTDLQGDTPRQRAEKAQDTELAAYLENRQHYQMIQREDQETAV